MNEENSNCKPAKRWQEIAREAKQESNPGRLRALARELNEAVLNEERKRVPQKLGSVQHFNVKVRHSIDHDSRQTWAPLTVVANWHKVLE